MKTFLVCILAAVIASSNGFLLSLLGGGSEQHSAPQEYLHHHHHHHEVLHKSVPVEQHSLAVENYIQKPVESHPQYVQIFKVIHESGPSEGHDAPHGYAQAPVLTKVIQPVVNKNFYQSRHEHHYHQVHHGGQAPVFHHQKW